MKLQPKDLTSVDSWLPPHSYVKEQVKEQIVLHVREQIWLPVKDRIWEQVWSHIKVNRYEYEFAT